MTKSRGPGPWGGPEVWWTRKNAKKCGQKKEGERKKEREEEKGERRGKRKRKKKKETNIQYITIVLCGAPIGPYGAPMGLAGP